MRALRLSLACPGATAADYLSIGEQAVKYGLNLWIGDPGLSAPNSDDSYVTAAAAALAAATRDVRIGLFLSLRGTATPLRIAEDINVIDQMSGGRLDLAFVPPAEGAAHWSKSVEMVLNASGGWPMADERTPAVTPPSAQRSLPFGIVGDHKLASQLGGWSIATPTAAQSAPGGILLIQPELGERGVEAWLAESPRERITELKEQAETAGANEVILVLRVQDLTENDMLMLGSVLAIGFRASDGDRPNLIEDAWNWATTKREFHKAPE